MAATNLAYEYDLFEDKPRPEIKKLEAQQGVKAHKSRGIVKAICYSVIAVILVSALLYTRAVQAELNSDYTQTEKLLNELKGENARRQIQIEEMLSLSNIEDIAVNELGLTTGRTDQIEYVNFTTEDKVEVVKKQSVWTNVASFFKSIFE